MTKKNPLVDQYLNNRATWQKEFKKLRKIILETELQEEFKWKKPCYTFESANVAILIPLKKYITLTFFKGVLLDDSEGVLNRIGPNSQAGRQMRFESLKEITELTPTIKKYLAAAIAIETSGQKVKIKKVKVNLPDELQRKLKKSATFKKAFNALTPGRQRGYILFFSSAKSVEARERRIEKYTERILKGKGMNDCVCGLSKKMPGCDGSHKSLL